jgi:hypothetical protein
MPARVSGVKTTKLRQAAPTRKPGQCASNGGGDSGGGGGGGSGGDEDAMAALVQAQLQRNRALASLQANQLTSD